MFTVCPGCTKQFRLHAEQIAAASGQVRCGFCHIQFNALEHLYDEPLSKEKITESILPDQDLDGEPQFTIPDEGLVELVEPGLSEPEQDLSIGIDEGNIDQGTSAEPQFSITGQDEAELIDLDNVDLEEDILISNNEASVDQELSTAINEIGIRSAVDEPEFELKNEVIEDKAPVSVEKNREETHYEFPDPEALMAEPPVNRNWIPTLLWSSACFVALITISLQLGWFNRDLILKQYPQLTPYVKQLCKEQGCRLIRQRDAREIKLVNRDVRLHPRYQDTLLVNATMKNELPVRQPYPRVQLTLFDTSGALLGHREFIPDDYLDNSIEIDEGMPINDPVHFVLEVSGPTAGAVSFEFRFL